MLTVDDLHALNALCDRGETPRDAVRRLLAADHTLSDIADAVGHRTSPKLAARLRTFAGRTPDT
jgi:hypothetical protein